jgi:hypothetical protein
MITDLINHKTKKFYTRVLLKMETRARLNLKRRRLSQADSTLSLLLQHEFQRYLYCTQKAEKSLQIHNWFYHFGRIQDGAEGAYNTVMHALEACYSNKIPCMQSYYQPKPIILQTYHHFKQLLGRDIARLIVNMAFMPTEEEFFAAGQSVLRRASCVKNTSFAPKWGDELIHTIIKRVSSS